MANTIFEAMKARTASSPSPQNVGNLFDAVKKRKASETSLEELNSSLSGFFDASNNIIDTISKTQYLTEDSFNNKVAAGQRQYKNYGSYGEYLNKVRSDRYGDVISAQKTEAQRLKNLLTSNKYRLDNDSYQSVMSDIDLELQYLNEALSGSLTFGSNGSKPGVFSRGMKKFDPAAALSDVKSFKDSKVNKAAADNALKKVTENKGIVSPNYSVTMTDISRPDRTAEHTQRSEMYAKMASNAQTALENRMAGATPENPLDFSAFTKPVGYSSAKTVTESGTGKSDGSTFRSAEDARNYESEYVMFSETARLYNKYAGMSPSEAAAYCYDVFDDLLTATNNYYDNATPENKNKLDTLKKEKTDIEEFLNILCTDDYDGNYAKFTEAIKKSNNSKADRTADRLFASYAAVDENSDKLAEYEVYRQSPDYEAGTKYNEETGLNDPVYRYIAIGGSEDWLPNPDLRYMEGGERSMYIYLYNVKGKEEADKYLDILEFQLGMRASESENKKTQRIAEEHPIISGIAAPIESVLLAPAGAVDYAFQYINKAFTGEDIDPYSIAQRVSQSGSNRAASVTDYVENNYGAVAATAYQVVESVLENVGRMAVGYGFGTAAGLTGTALNSAVGNISGAIMAMQVAPGAISEGIKKGYSDEKALALGIIQAAIEGVTEKYSLETILSNPQYIMNIKNKWLRGAAKTGLGAIAEGSEEVASNWLNGIVDTIANGSKSEFEQRVREYMAEGNSRIEAHSLAILDGMGDDALSFLMGGLAGMIMGGGSAVKTQSDIKSQQRRINSDIKLAENNITAAILAEENKRLSEGLDGDYYYTKITDKLVKGKKITQSDINRLVQENVKLSQSQNGEREYAFVGPKAKTADLAKLSTAEKMEQSGVDSETIRKATGWVRGSENMWRFEINDSNAELVENPQFELHEYGDGEYYRTGRLGDIFKHDELFQAYPELQDYTVIIQDTEPGTRGTAFPDRGEIVLSSELFKQVTKEYDDYLNGGRKAEIERIESTPEYKEYARFYDDPELANIDPEKWLALEKEARDKFYSSELGKRYHELNWGKTDIRKYEPGWSKEAKAVLIHELQHAVQKIEGFASGSSPEYWQSKINSAESEYRRAEKEYEKRYDGLVDVLARYGFSDEKFENIDLTTESGVKEAKKYLEEVGAPNGALELADALIEYANDRNNAFGKYLKLKNRSASDLYESTAGEIEARDVANRLNYTEEQRKNIRPDIDRTDVVFAKDGGVSYEIKHDKDGNEYWQIDTGKDIFKNIESKEDIRKAAFNFLMENRDYNVMVEDSNGRKIQFIRISAEEFTNSDKSQDLYKDKNELNLFNKKMRMIPSLQDILLHSKTQWHSPDMKNHKLFKKRGFENYRGKVRVDNVIFNTVVRVGKTYFGEVFYDINIEVDRILPHAKSASEIIKKADLYDPTVPQKTQSVNSSISENSENDTNSFTSMRESIEKRMKAKGLNVTYDPNEANSFYVPGTDKVVIGADATDEQAYYFLLGHELAEKIIKSDNGFSEEVLSAMQSYGRDVEGEAAKLNELYFNEFQRLGKSAEEALELANGRKELSCNFIGEILSSEDIQNYLGKEKPGLLRKIADGLRNFISRHTGGLIDSAEERNLRALDELLRSKVSAVTGQEIGKAKLDGDSKWTADGFEREGDREHHFQKAEPKNASAADNQGKVWTENGFESDGAEGFIGRDAELNDRSLFDSMDERAEMTPGVQQEINLGSERPVKALRQLKTDISEAFNIRDGYKRDMGRILEGVSKTMLDGGKLSDSDIDSLLDSVIAASDVPYVNEELAGIQQEIKGAKIKINQQVKSDISDYDALRKSLNGLVVLTGGKGRALDTYYAELNSMFGEGYFPSEVTDGAEQLKIIADIMLKDSAEHRSLEAAAYDEGGDDGMEAARAQARRDLIDILKNYEISANRELRGYAEDKAGKYERQIERANDTKQRRRQKVENAINEVEDYRDKNQVELDSRDGSDKEAWMNLHRAIRENSKYLSYYERQLTADEKEQLKLALEKRILPSVMEMPEGEYDLALMDDCYSLEVEKTKLESERAHRLAKRNERLADKVKDAFLDIDGGFNEKKNGAAYSVLDPTRVWRSLSDDTDTQEKLLDTFFRPIKAHNADRDRYAGELKDKVYELNIDRTVKEGNQNSEAYVVQLLGEAEGNIEYLSKNPRLRKHDGYTLEQWQEIKDDCIKNNPNLDYGHVNKCIKAMRNIYDDIHKKWNDVNYRLEQSNVEYRTAYFPHFESTERMELEKTLSAKLRRILGIKMNETELPTEIAGLTKDFKPNKKWTPHDKARTGYHTDYDAVEGFEKYIDGVAEQIYHTEDILLLRVLEAEIRKKYTQEEVVARRDKKIEELNSDLSLSAEERDEALMKFDKGKDNDIKRFSSFVQWLHEYTNILAGKKSESDRTAEYMLGRDIYNLSDWMCRQMSANMVGGNIASAFTNILPLFDGGAELKKKYLVPAMLKTVANIGNQDSIIEKSDFLTSRFNSPRRLVQTNRQKVSDASQFVFESIDKFTAYSLWQARYEQNLKNKKKHYTEAEAIKEADEWVASVMADRSTGATPTLFNRKSIHNKVFTAFQLEVNNQWQRWFIDLPRRAKDEGVKWLVKTVLQIVINMYLCNEISEKVIGRRIAPDPIGTVKDLVENIMDENVSGKAAAVRAIRDIGGELPFVGGIIFGGGRIPLTGAYPIVDDLWDWLSEEKTEINAEDLAWDTAQSAAYAVLPFGANQLFKSVKGAKVLAEGGSYKDSGDDRILQYPVELGEPTAENILDKSRAVLFGKNSLPEAREWRENGYNSLSAAETATYDELKSDGSRAGDIYPVIQAIKEVEEGKNSSYNVKMGVQENVKLDFNMTSGDKADLLKDMLDAGKESKAKAKRSILDESDLDGNEKLVIYKNLILPKDSKKRDLCRDLPTMGADPGEVYSALSQMDDCSKSKDKFDCIESSELDDSSKLEIYKTLIANDDRRGMLWQLNADGYSDSEMFEAVSIISDDSENKKKDNVYELSASKLPNGLKYTVYTRTLATDKEKEAARVLEDDDVDKGKIYSLLDKVYRSEESKDKRAVLAASNLNGTQKLEVFKILFASDKDKEFADSVSGETSESVYKLLDKLKSSGSTVSKKLDAIADSGMSDDNMLKAYYDYVVDKSDRMEAASKASIVRDNGIPVKVYLQAKSDVSQMETTALSGKKQKAKFYVDSLDLTVKQKKVLFELLGYKNTDDVYWTLSSSSSNSAESPKGLQGLFDAVRAYKNR